MCFSETRFAAYAYRVFNFLENYAVVWHVLETIASSDEPCAKEAYNLLRCIRTLDSVGKIARVPQYVPRVGITK